MYRIREDKNGATLVCRACTLTERVQGFNRNIWKPADSGRSRNAGALPCGAQLRGAGACTGDGHGTAGRAPIWFPHLVSGAIFERISSMRNVFVETWLSLLRFVLVTAAVLFIIVRWA